MAPARSASRQACRWGAHLALGAALVACSPPRKEPSLEVSPEPPDTPGALARPAPLAPPSASLAPPAPAPSVRVCRPGERRSQDCDCGPDERACFDICCGPNEGCAHPLKPGGPSACLLLPPPHPRLVFACDEKYASPSCNEATWLPTQTVYQIGGLLQHQEGGPEGAVWNGNAALWVGVPEGAREVSFGGPLLPGPSLGGRRWYRVAPEQWRQRLRPVAGKPYRQIELQVDGRRAGAFWFAEGE